MRIEAISVNPEDTKIRRSKGPDHHEALPQVLGWDAAGVVEGTGNEARMFQAGDAMYYSGIVCRPGCNSEYHLVDERIVAQKPISWSMAQSAALPLTAITAYEALFERMGNAQDGRTDQNPFTHQRG